MSSNINKPSWTKKLIKTLQYITSCNLGWFLNTNKSKSAEIDCNLCGKVFPSLNHFFKHKKIEHVTTVQQCKNETSNSCQYGAEKCWYRQNLITSNEENNVNQEVIKKIFNMMEQFTKRILNLENKQN